MNSNNKLLTVSILGCGWYGLALAKSLIEKGYHVKGSTTSGEKLNALKESGIDSYQVNFSTEDAVYNPQFFQSDVLFIAIPPKRKSGESDYYPQKIKAICKAATSNKVKHVILISSTGVYENTGKEFNELDSPQPTSESGKALFSAENIVLAQKDFTTTILRFGGLFGPGRNPGRFLKGKNSIPNGLAPVNMTHLNDCLAISHAILEQESFGKIYNACSPQHPSRIDFYTHYSISANEEAPDFVHELHEWKIINSVNIPLYLKYIFQEALIS
ncbi:NAD(P)H-binding protein [Albibacterium bauzanense]|uniref:Nucleoside-diphosphate-sugar epimerase n=1 Tax=Albibacterium bauzanense TaxID=653929 RepID=A0A4R1M1Y3_9SPHI|nr:NAD(P)H-binding protein [Albibacterium bauzanense]TCK85010.1 nucleoside-diphosphate-sugar epimerase [Albibacterium bauzanense]